MPGSERCSLVQKKQFCVTPHPHHSAMAILERKAADNPARAAIEPHNVLRLVVQAPAIAHQSAARFSGDELAKRCDAIAFRHKFFTLAHAAEFPQALQIARRGHVPPANSVGHVANVERALRIYSHTVRRDELRWPFAFFRVAEARL
jgi:hypothetical protein